MSGLLLRAPSVVSVRLKLFAILTVSLLIAVIVSPKLLPNSPNPQAVSSTFVISQIQAAGDGSPTPADDEFIEIHNVSGSALDLNGYRVVYRSSTGTSDLQIASWNSTTMVPAGGYYLIAHTPSYNGTAASDRSFDAGVAFSATAGGMAIRNSGGTIVDSIRYGTATNAFVEGTSASAPTTNNSMARKSSGCQDTDDNSSDFALLTPAAPRNSGTIPVICSGGPTPTPTATPRLVKVSDFDADNHADIAVWQPASGMWRVSNSGDSTATARQWGAGSLNDIPVPGDYDGDGAADMAVFRPNEGNWYVLNSSTNTVTIVGWGASTDEIVQADYDGDGKTDIAVFRPSEGNWYIKQSSTGTVQLINWGASGDKPVPGDYDGDGKADPAVFRPAEGNWYIRKSSGGTQLIGWGAATDQLVAGDYDGDGKLDPAVFRPSEGNWYIRQSSNNAMVIRNWGASSDVVAPADYDGDKKTDVAVWRPSEAVFYIVNSSGSPVTTVQQYGNFDDVPIASTYKTFGSSDGVTTPAPTPTPLTDNHLAMGNPSNAVADTNFPLNYLMSKPQYALSYNRDLGEPNWVSWHLDSTWLGSAPRQNDYRADPAVPAGWYQVQGTDYSGSGFDRGHMCPSGDRTDSVTDNSATFLMTNFIPQAAANNQGPWNDLEIYCRALVSQGNELYIISGGYGSGGTGLNGFATTVANGHVNVPAQTWKVIIVLPAGSGDDAARVTTSTRTIAVIMPNSQSVNPDWKIYRVSVDQVEALTGYDFFSNVPVSIQAVVEASVDNQ